MESCKGIANGSKLVNVNSETLSHIDFWAAQFRWLIFFFCYSSSDWRLSDHISPFHCIQIRMMLDTGNWISSAATETLNEEKKQQSPFVVEYCAWVFQSSLYLCLSCCLLWAMPCFVTALYKLHCVNAIILRGIYFGIYISLFDGQPKLIRVGLRIMKGFLVGNWDTCWY